MTIQLLTDNLTELRVEVTIPQTLPAHVFECWTQAGHLEKWWVQKVIQLDVQTGGAYAFHWMVKNSTLRGFFTEVMPAERLSFTWKWDHLPELLERTVTLQFEVVDSVDTRLKIWHHPYDDSTPDQEERQNHIDGWQYFMEMLLNYCAT